jgi:hypothetical protein
MPGARLATGVLIFIIHKISISVNIIIIRSFTEFINSQSGIRKATGVISAQAPLGKAVFSQTLPYSIPFFELSHTARKKDVDDCGPNIFLCQFLQESISGSLGQILEKCRRWALKLIRIRQISNIWTRFFDANIIPDFNSKLNPRFILSLILDSILVCALIRLSFP